MGKKNTESSENITSKDSITTDSMRYSIEQLRKSINVLGCSQIEFEGAVAYATKQKIISDDGVTIAEMKKIINKWLKLPIK